MHACMYVCMCVCVYVCVYIYIYIHMYICTYVHIYVDLYADIYVDIYARYVDVCNKPTWRTRISRIWPPFRGLPRPSPDPGTESRPRVDKYIALAMEAIDLGFS